jgi:hypothetical protein
MEWCHPIGFLNIYVGVSPQELPNGRAVAAFNRVDQ